MRRLTTLLLALAAVLPLVAQTGDMALVTLSVACMRSMPKYSAELVSQAVMGTPVKLLEKNGGWWRVQTPEGYEGWVWRASIEPCSRERMGQWRSSSRLIYSSYSQGAVYADFQGSSPRDAVSDIVLGSIVEGDLSSVVCDRVQVTLPDGRSGWVDAAAVQPLDKWAAQPYDADLILDCAYSMMGAPYLWGGASTKGTDCSGLVKVCYYANGYILRRDASQQALTGETLAADWRGFRGGDLLFFSGSKDSRRVSHVAIYDADGWYVHCAGKVRRNSIDPGSAAYDNGHYPLSATRIQGMEGTDGITRAADHPWYF